MKQLVLLFGILLCFVWMGCGSAQDFCGEGTKAQDGKCIPNYPKKECASGTVDEQGQCKPAFEKIECGEGTSPKDGQCVPDYEKRECAEGTVLKDGKCEPAYEKITCGQGTKQNEGQCLPEKTLSCSDGTREENGQCIPDDPKEICGPGKVLLGGQCLTARSQWIRLPFEEGFSVTISQGHHGSFSHKGSSAYSIDFSVPEGTKIAAVRAGLVIGTKSDSDSGCGDSSCASQANYVYIDHGDGTSARYLHLQKDGVKVKLGDQVCPGQVIGLSGNTGFSTGPHLHLEILDGLGLSQPIYFEALRDTSAGVAYPGLRVTSQNKALSTCTKTTSSMCAKETFAYRGVIMNTPFDCWGLERGKTYTFEGKVADETSALAFNVQFEGGGWQRQCVQVTNRAFKVDFTWPKERPAGYAYTFMSTGQYRSSGGCSSVKGWSNSLRIWSK